jgi:hypothetical protein
MLYFHSNEENIKEEEKSEPNKKNIHKKLLLAGQAHVNSSGKKFK